MIDEKKLIKETQKYFVNNSIHKNDLAEVIANLPKVGKWIPCSERLPEYTGEYNVTVGVSGMMGYFETATTLRYEILNGKHIGWKVADRFDEIVRVIAWQPLPPPYKESED